MADAQAPEVEEIEETEVFVTPTEIADATGADPKRVRAHLRAKYTRPLAQKNQSWKLSAEVAAAVIEHFEAGEEIEEDEVDEILED